MSSKRPVYLGIDLGTTNSAAAIFDGERVSLVRTAQGAALTPSVVRIDARGKVTVGERARRLLDQDPENVRSEFKRLMGSPQTLSFRAAGVARKPEELAAEVLRSIREDVKVQIGFVPERAVISVPALFELPQTAATSEAARLAGFERVEMIQEPVASGLGAGFRASDDVGSFLVYDLGGGTFDVSLIEARDGLLRVIGHDGDNFLGGRDFDAALVDHLIEQITTQTGTRISRDNPAHATALRRLRVLAEEAKIELSRAEEAEISIVALAVDGTELDLTLNLERRLLERLTERLVDRSIAICRRLLEAHGLTQNPPVQSVILVGGPTAMPFLRARVRDSLGAPFGEGLDPMTLVAEGAAYYAASTGLEARATSAATAPGAKVWLQFPAMSSDLSPFVVGKLVDASDRARVSHVVISRADGSWASEKEKLDPDGSFAVMVSLAPRRPNPLRIEGYLGESSEPVPLSPSDFVIVHGLTIGDPPLSRSVGVALADDAVKLFFERGSPLPLRRTFALRTVQALSPADSEAVLRVPIVQGEFCNAHLCRLVGAIEISASGLTTPLPVDSLVEVTIELDRGGLLSSSACLPQSGQIFKHVAQLVTGSVSPEELAARLADVRGRVHSARARAFKHGAQEVIKALTSADALANDCALAEGAARGGDQDAFEKAKRLLIELDALTAEAESALSWPDLDERARKAVTWAVAWVGDLGTQAEQHALADATAALKQASAARSEREVHVHLSTIRHLGSVAARRREGAWEEDLDDLVGDAAQSKDPKAFARILGEGRLASQQRDRAGVERAVRALWKLLPVSDPLGTRGHRSGVS